LWSTSVAGHGVRPGKSPEGALLVPLERARAQANHPPFVVEVAYLARGPALAERGTLALALPAIDLPISRTGVVLRHSPRYRVTAVTGSFRIETFADPATPVLREPIAAGPKAPPPIAAPVDSPAKSIDAMSAGRPGTLPGILPIDIAFPQFGELLYLVAELTPETQSAALGVQYERERGN
jgi:hypothetical protein